MNMMNAALSGIPSFDPVFSRQESQLQPIARADVPEQRTQHENAR
jgi:hypothetical protein